MPGSASAPVPSRPSIGPGGFGVRVDGVPQGVRDNVNLVTRPGVRWIVADDVGNSRVNIRAELDAEVLLAPPLTGLDLLTGTVLQSLISGLLGATRYQVTRIVVIAEDVTGVTIQPTVEAGTDAPGNPPNNDVAGSQALVLTATNQVQELALVAGARPSIDTTNLVRLRQTVAATATTYTVGVQVFGTVLTP